MILSELNILRFISKRAILLAGAVLGSTLAHAQQGPSNLNISGALFQADGSVVTSASVNFKIEIYDKTGGCLLYSEDHLGQDLSGSKGGFSLQIGQGSSINNAVDSSNPTVMTSKVFENNGVIAGGWAGCPSGATLASGDNRVIRVQYNLGGGYVTMNPDVPIEAAAYSIVAETLQGKRPSDFIQVHNDVSNKLTQANVENVFSSTNYPKLTDLLSGTSSSYISSNPTSAVGFNNQLLTNVASPVAATDATNKGYVDGNIGGKTADLSGVGPATGDGYTLIWDKTAGKWTTGVPSATDNTKLPLAGGTMSGAILFDAALGTGIDLNSNDLLATGHITMSPLKTLTLGAFTDGQETTLIGTLTAANAGASWYNTTSNTFKIWNGSAAISQTFNGATAGGDLTGTYPNPTIANDKITSAKVDSAGIGLNRLVISDQTTGANLKFATCGTNEVLRYEGVNGWICRDPSAIVTFPVKTVNGKTGDAAGEVTLNPVDLGLGTAALENVGTGAGDIPQLDAGGKIPSSLIPAASAPTWGDITNGAGKYMTYKPNNTACGNNELLKFDGTNWICVAASALGLGDFMKDGSVAMTGNLKLGANYISNDGGASEGLAFDTSGNANFTGNVGIGTTTPGSRLTVAGGGMSLRNASDTTDALTFYNTNNIATNPDILFQADGELAAHDNFQINIDGNNSGTSAWFRIGKDSYTTAATVLMTVEESGNVGIGTTTPSQLLDINGPIHLLPAALPGSPTAGVLAFDSGAANALKFYDGAAWQTVGTGTGNGDFKKDGSVPMTGNFNAGGNSVLGNTTASANLTLESTSDATKGYVNIQPNGGNVGIGTTTPNTLLDVNGSLWANTINGGTITAQNAVGPAYIISQGYTSDPYSYSVFQLANLGNSKAWSIHYRNGNTVPGYAESLMFNYYDGSAYADLVTFAANGNVGIGTTAPARLLHVEGAARFTPTTEPTSPAAGDLFFDSGAANALKFYDGAAWQTVGTGTGSGDFMKNGSVAMTGDFNAGTKNLTNIGTNINAAAGLTITTASNNDLNLAPNGTGLVTTSSALRVTPTALPGTPAAGTIAFDSGASNVLKYYNGSAWQTVNTSNATGDFMKDGSVAMTGDFNAGAHNLTNIGANITGAAAVTLASGGTSDLTLTSASGVLNSTTPLKISPTTLPATPAAGTIAMDSSTGNAMKYYDGTAWQTLGTGTGSGDFMKNGSVAMTGDFDGGTHNITNVGSVSGSALTLTSTGANNGITLTPNGTGLVTTSSALLVTPTALPGSPAAGTIAFDSGASNALKFYDGAAWQTVGTGTGNGDFKKDGSVAMTGNFNAGGNSVLGNTTASANLTLESTSDATKGYILLQPNGGNVGVGTSTPAYLMDLMSGSTSNVAFRLDGRAVIGGVNSLGTAQVGVLAPNGSGAAIAGENSQNNFFAGSFRNSQSNDSVLMAGGSTNSGAFEVKANGASASLLVAHDGTVGIGTNNPARLLHVNGAARFTPTTEPTSPAAGDLFFDSGAANALKFYDGAAWQTVGTGTGSGDFMKNGSVAMTGDFDGGTHNITNIGAVSGSNVSITSTGANNGITLTPNGTGLVTTSSALLVTPTALPATPAAGVIAFDSGASNALKYYNGSAWQTVNTSNATGDFMKDGSVTMTGDFNAGTHNLTAVGAISGSSLSLSSTGANSGITLTPNGTGLVTTSSALLVTPTALPGTPAAGTIAFDSGASNALKFYDGAAWQTVGTGTGNGDFKKDGSVAMTGNFNAGGNSVLGNTTASANLKLESTSDATKGYVLIQPNGGKVGIGTTTPAGVLTVSADSSAANPDLRISNAANNLRIDVRTDGGSGWIGTSTGQSFILGSSSQNQLTLALNGNVGLNDTVPGTLFEAKRADATPYVSSSNTLSSPIGITSSAIRVVNGVFGDGRAAYSGLAATNSSSNIQNAYIGVVANAGASVYTPSLVFGQQTDAAAYAERMRIDSSGNVGIGTDTPARLLHVNGAARFTPTTTPATPAAGDLFFDSAASNALKFYDGSAWQTVGTGTGSGDFMKNGSVAMTGNFNAGGNSVLGNTTASANLKLESTSDATKGYVLIQPNGGNVGIGTSSPADKLDVFVNAAGAGGGISLQNLSATGVSSLSFNTDGGVNRGAVWLDNNNGNFYVGSGSTDLIFQTSTTSGAYEKMRIASDGNVGIGTDTPARLLHVNGAARLTPTTTPATPAAGDLFFDSAASNALKFYDGSAWQTVGTGTGSGDFMKNGSVAMTGNLKLGANYISNDGGASEGLAFDTSGNANFTGNVGIGTTTPNASFQVASGGQSLSIQPDNLGFTTISANGTSDIAIGSNAASSNQIYMTASTGTGNFGINGTPTAGTVLDIFGWNTGNSPVLAVSSGNGTGSGNLMIVNGNGRVGIGTSSPVDLVSLGAVNASATHASLNLSNTALSGASASGTYIGANPASASADFINYQVAGTTKFSVDKNGKVTGDGSGLTGISAAPAGSNTQVQFNNSGTMGASANLVWDNTNGRLGIGTATPATKLHVNGNAEIDGNIDSGIITGDRLNTLKSTAATYTPTGSSNLPDGAAVAAWNTYGDDNIGAYLFLSANNSSTKEQDAYIGAITNTGSGSYTPTIVIGQSTSANTYAERMRIDASGNVGIGTTAPARLLHVNGAARLTPTTTPASAAAGDLFFDSAASNALKFYDGSAWQTVGTGTSSGDFKKDGSVAMTGNLKLGANYISNDGGASEGLAFDTSGNANFTGNVGVGTASPIDLLSLGAVNASATRASLNLSNTALSGASASGTYIGANPASASADFINYQVNGTTKFKVDKDGKVTGDGSGLTGISAAPAGANTQIQFNNSGAMGASASLIWDNTNSRLGINIAAPVVQFSNTNASPVDAAGNGAVGSAIAWANSASGYAAALYNANSSAASGGLLVKSGGNTTNPVLSVDYGATSAGAGTALFRVLGNGKVGIGTTAPAEKLTVATGNGSWGLLHTAGGVSIGTWVDGSSGNAQIGTKSNTDLQFFTNDGPPQMALTTGGWFGVGTDSPNYLLEAHQNYNGQRSIGVSNLNTGTAAEAALTAEADTSTITLSAMSSGYTTSGVFQANRVVLAGESNSAMVIDNESNTPLIFATNGTERARINNTGSVGIGTTSPARLLHVNGAARLTPTTTPATPAAGDLFFDSAASNALKFYDGSAWQTVGTGTGSGDFMKDGSVAMTGNLKLGANYISNDGGASEGLAFDTSGNANFTGNLGVGTATPGNRLEVYKSADSSTNLIINNPNTGTSAETGLQLNTNAGSVGYFWTGGSNHNQVQYRGRVMITSDGTNGGGIGIEAIGGSSDIRFSAGGNLNADERMRITSTGNVGIGTDTPARLLHVNGAARLTPTTTPATPAAGDLFFDSAASNALKFYDGSAWQTVGTGTGTGDFKKDGSVAMTGNLKLGANYISNDGGASEGLAFDTSGNANFTGNVGIGTTSPTMAKLVVPGYVGSSGGTSAVFGNSLRGVSIMNDWPGVGFNYYYDGSDKSLDDGYGSLIAFDADNGDMYFSRSSASAGAADAALTLNTTMVMKQNGNVGIGTSTPAALLDVNGPIHVTPAALPGSPTAGTLAFDSGASNALKFYNGTAWQTVGTGTGSGDFMKDGSVAMTGNLKLGANYISNDGGASEGLAFDTSGNANFTGNIGIGTTSPVGYGSGGPILGLRGTASTVPEISLDATPIGGNNWVTVSDNTGNFYFRNVTTNNSPITLHNDSAVDIDRIAVGTYAGTAPPANGMIIPGNVGIGTTTPTSKLDVAGTVKATAVDTPSILSSGVETLRVNTVASGVNYLTAAAGTAGNGPTLSTSGTDGVVPLNIYTKGGGPILLAPGQAPALKLYLTASAVNYLQMQGSTAGSAPLLSVGGTDTNIDIKVTPKGTGNTVFTSGNVGIGTTTPNATLQVSGNVNRTTEYIASSVNSGTALTLSSISATGGSYQVALTGNATITLPADPGITNGVAQLTVVITQDATGSRTLSWSPPGGDTLLWSGGVTPSVCSSANQITIYQFIKVNGVSNWYGAQVWRQCP